jgi:hypothetical protein
MTLDSVILDEVRVVKSASGGEKVTTGVADTKLVTVKCALEL